MLGSSAFASTMVSTSTPLTNLGVGVSVIFLEVTFTFRLTKAFLLVVLFPLSIEFLEILFVAPILFSKLSVSMCFRE